MTELNPLQKALIPHLGAEVYLKMRDDSNTLAAQNRMLKDRIDYLERQIATQISAGWQLH